MFFSGFPLSFLSFHFVFDAVDDFLDHVVKLAFLNLMALAFLLDLILQFVDFLQCLLLVVGIPLLPLFDGALDVVLELWDIVLKGAGDLVNIEFSIVRLVC